MTHHANDHHAHLIHTHSSEAKATVEKIIAELKQKNIRITEPRRAILTYMVESHTHPTVEEIYNDLLPQFPGMSLATIYNNLNTLVEHGYVHEMKFSGITSRYDFMGHQHFHIFCDKCGKVTDFPAHDVKPILENATTHTQYKVRSLNVEMFGICPDCQKDSLL